jgi:pimeloyl-ACP methyl ester carboxylesterase
LRHLAPEVTCPILFAWAKGDRYIAWSRSKRAALKFPNRQVRFFDGGHSAFLEAPSAFIEAVNTPPPKGGGFGLRLEAGLIDPSGRFG